MPAAPQFRGDPDGRDNGDGPPGRGDRHERADKRSRDGPRAVATVTSAQTADPPTAAAPPGRWRPPRARRPPIPRRPPLPPGGGDRHERADRRSRDGPPGGGDRHERADRRSRDGRRSPRAVVTATSAQTADPATAAAPPGRWRPPRARPVPRMSRSEGGRRAVRPVGPYTAGSSRFRASPSARARPRSGIRPSAQAIHRSGRLPWTVGSSAPLLVLWEGVLWNIRVDPAVGGVRPAGNGPAVSAAKRVAPRRTDRPAGPNRAREAVATSRRASVGGRGTAGRGRRAE